MSSENTAETVTVQTVMDAATASYLIRQRNEETERLLAQAAGRDQELTEAYDEIARLTGLNSALKNKVAELEEKLASRGGARGPSQAILDRQARCRPVFLAAAGSGPGGTNAADLVSEGLSLKDKGWVLNDIYAVAEQAERAGLVVKRCKGRKAFWYTPEVLNEMEARLAVASQAQAEALVAEKAALAAQDEEVVIDLG